MSFSLTTDEIISLINRSRLPTLLVEGKTDSEVLRKLESRLGVLGAIIKCNGRTRLYEIIRQKNRIKRKNIAFLADRDSGVIFGDNIDDDHLVYTWGYSIENDILSCNIPAKLMSPEELESLKSYKLLISRWFARELEKSKNGLGEAVLDVHIEQIIDVKNAKLKSTFPEFREIEIYDTPLTRKIHRNFSRLMRGKQILQIHQSILNAPGRPSRINGSALRDICCASRKRQLYLLLSAIRKLLLAESNVDIEEASS